MSKNPYHENEIETGVRMKRYLWAFAAFLYPVTASSCATDIKPASILVETNDMNVNVEDVRDPIAFVKFPRTLQSNMDKNSTMNGLANISPEIKYQIEVMSLNGCAWLNEVKLSVLFSNPSKVYITNKYSRDSCEYRAIYNHEMQHVQIAFDTRVKYVPILKSALETSLPKIRFITGNNIDYAKEELIRRVRETMDPYVQQMLSESNSKNAMIDTNESYAAVQKNCSKW